MTKLTTLAALLLSACAVPALQAGSTFSASSPSTSPAPASPAPAAPQPARSPQAAPVAATPAPTLDKDDVSPIEGAARWLSLVTSGEVAPGHGTKEEQLRDQVIYCSTQVKNLIKHDIPLATKLPLEHGEATLGEAEAKICQALAKAADGWDARADKAYAAQDDAELEPFRKVGIAGDKLKLVSDLGQQLIAPGQADATPERVAHASVLFSLRHDGYRQWTIVRYAFKGNTQISVTEKGYKDQPGADQFR